ncbi:MAG: hypothetical protein R6V19_17255 [Armatimonadota bacterium]
MSDLKSTTYTLTVAAGKRLIAKAVAQYGPVKDGMESGTVAVAKGTTNAYVLEELLGEKIDKGAYVLGKNLPPNFEDADGIFKGSMDEVVFKNGEIIEGVGVKEAAPDMKAGDVVIKGANALDLDNGCAGLLIGAPTGGTLGGLIGPVYGRGLHMIIPVGLEKQVAGSLRTTAQYWNVDPELRRPKNPGLWIMEGEIITELQAIEILTGAEAMQLAAGGVCGAEGTVWLAVTGTSEQIDAADALIDSVRDEPSFGS